MHFHLPKPLHGWRAFVGEVGIIVLGVLIALTAEQLVEEWHWKQEVADASRSLDGYLDHVKFAAVQRIQMRDCIARKLDRLDDLISASKRPKIVRVDLAPIRLWPTSGWQAATASGAVAHMSLEQRGRYAVLYDFTAGLGERNRKESDAIGELQLLNRPRTLSEGMRDRLIEDIAQLRQSNRLMALGAQQWLELAQPLRLQVTPEDARVLRESNRCIMPDDPAANAVPANA
jgi:hypothetical protein